MATKEKIKNIIKTNIKMNIDAMSLFDEEDQINTIQLACYEQGRVALTMMEVLNDMEGDSINAKNFLNKVLRKTYEKRLKHINDDIKKMEEIEKIDLDKLKEIIKEMH